MSTVRIVITQGEFVVCDEKNVLIATLLGSCVAVCLWDSLAEVGGMNHMLLTGAAKAGTYANIAGVHAMECLVNELLKRGGARQRLQAKVFGGARMVQGLSAIGAANCKFALSYLEKEGIPVASNSLGGTEARQLLFCPTTGQVRQKVVQDRMVVAQDLVAQPAVVRHGSQIF